jgi:hypothetical protein
MVDIIHIRITIIIIEPATVKPLQSFRERNIRGGRFFDLGMAFLMLIVLADNSLHGRTITCCLNALITSYFNISSIQDYIAMRCKVHVFRGMIVDFKAEIDSLKILRMKPTLETSYYNSKSLNHQWRTRDRSSVATFTEKKQKRNILDI